MKIVTVVGARPQFIKAAVVTHKLRKKHTEILVHTGQHFDENMSDTFFRQLDIPNPDYNLGISGGSHAEMTGKMMIAIEKVLIKEKPDWLLIYGDTNSTLAGALAAAKLHINICHVEAGNRTHYMTNPEEVNRICSDHISALLLACTDSCKENLIREGLGEKTYVVGDPMFDAFELFSQRISPDGLELQLLGGGDYKTPREYYYLTCHREENTDRENALSEIFKAMNDFDAPTIYPVHPRNKERAAKIKKESGFDNIILTEPVGYFESTALIRNSKMIVTDSGGVQREAFFAEKKCLTVLDFAFWPETLNGNRNMLVKPDVEDILQKYKIPQQLDENYQPFGDGHSVDRIIKAIEEYREN